MDSPLCLERPGVDSVIAAVRRLDGRADKTPALFAALQCC